MRLTSMTAFSIAFRYNSRHTIILRMCVRCFLARFPDCYVWATKGTARRLQLSTELTVPHVDEKHFPTHLPSSSLLQAVSLSLLSSLPPLASLSPSIPSPSLHPSLLPSPDKVAMGILELILDTSKVGAVMTVTEKRGIDYFVRLPGEN